MRHSDLIVDTSYFLLDCQVVSIPLLQDKYKFEYKKVVELIDELCKVGVLKQNEIDYKIVFHSITELEIHLKKRGFKITNYKSSILDRLKIEYKSYFTFLIAIGVFLIGTTCMVLINNYWIQIGLTYQDKETIIALFLIGLVTYFLWIIKDTPFGFLWRWYKLFWLILLATLMVNFAKKQVKEWWRREN